MRRDPQVEVDHLINDTALMRVKLRCMARFNGIQVGPFTIGDGVSLRLCQLWFAGSILRCQGLTLIGTLPTAFSIAVTRVTKSSRITLISVASFFISLIISLGSGSRVF